MAKKNTSTKKTVSVFFLAGLFLLVVLLIAFAVIVLIKFPASTRIRNFDDCVKAGNPVLDSYPEKCQAEGKTYTKIIKGVEVSIGGTIICLPHKDTSGPQTLECAFGLLSEGVNYGMANFAIDTMGQFPTGALVIVKGTLREPEPENIYDIAAVIDLTDVVLGGHD